MHFRHCSLCHFDSDCSEYCYLGPIATELASVPIRPDDEPLSELMMAKISDTC